jgi:hypothetical protein
VTHTVSVSRRRCPRPATVEYIGAAPSGSWPGHSIKMPFRTGGPSALLCQVVQRIARVLPIHPQRISALQSLPSQGIDRRRNDLFTLNDLNRQFKASLTAKVFNLKRLFRPKVGRLRQWPMIYSENHFHVRFHSPLCKESSLVAGELFKWRHL